jgi:eukaryotic-like serine/threonine-protein kinase
VAPGRVYAYAPSIQAKAVKMGLQPGDRLGPYEVLGALGAGGMGEVYRARDPRLGRVVAVKVLPPSLIADKERRHRFEHEARAAGALNHPNILGVHDVGEHEGAPYLVMELLEGESLRGRLRTGSLSVRKAVDFAVQVSRGLAAAHARGIVHRDLKPENLFVTRDGLVKILDFGLARQLVDNGSGSGATKTLGRDTAPGVVMGTVGYMSPEQARGDPADHRSDIFALGAVMYEMLTGRRAFQRSTSVETLNAILKEEPPEFPDDLKIPPGLDRLVRHCLEKRAEDRFQSARDLAFELEGFSTTTDVVGRTRPLPAAPRARWWIAGIASALAAVAAVGAAYRLGVANAPSVIPTYRQLTFGRGIVASGRFTVDGRSVVYSAVWDDRAAPEIFEKRVDAPESTPLALPHGHVVAVSSKSELAMLLTDESLFPVAGRLARVPLSGGTPRPVAENVLCGDWAPDGEQLAVVRDVGGAYVTEFPIGKVVERRPRTSGRLICPRFSPRGDRLALGGPDGYRILELRSGRSTTLPATEYGAGEWWAWSPDGQEIWYTASDAVEDRPLSALSLAGKRRVLARVAGALSLYDVSREGGVLVEHAFSRIRSFVRVPGEAEDREVTVFDRAAIGDLSANGSAVLLHAKGAATGNRTFAYVRQMNGDPPMKLSENGEATSLSPDGAWVLAIPDGPTATGLRVIPTGVGEPRDVPVPGLRIYTAKWAPDGRRLLVSAAEIEGNKGQRVYLLDGDGGGRRALTPEGVYSEGIIACDGNRIAVGGPDGRVTLYPLDGGAARAVPGLEPGLTPLRFSADGQALFVASPRAGRTAPVRLYRAPLAGGAKTLLFEIRPPELAGVWNLTAWSITADGRGYAYTYCQFFHSLFLAQGVR